MKRLSDEKKSRACFKIQELLHEIEFEQPIIQCPLANMKDAMPMQMPDPNYNYGGGKGSFM